MAEYINRDLIVKNSMLHTWKKADLLRAIKEAPTADVVEVRHGEWVNKNGIYECSECGYTCPYDAVGDNIEFWECLYCRHCGAKMDGERRDT